jgi:predicted nucleic acid-binding protein
VTENLIESAAQLAETESLRGYDAVHLACALLVGAAVFSSSDRDLCEAAERHGLHIANPLPT